MQNKIWLITGVSSGLGKAMAETVIKRGDFVIATFRKQSQVESFNELYADKAEAIILDITDLNKIVSQIKYIIEKYNRIDVLVNNAGIGIAGAIEEVSMEEARAVFESNFFGTLKLTQAVLPYMRHEKSGHIIQISSHAGIKAFAGFGIYNASKFALEGFSEALAQEIKPVGIKITIVEPGPFRTNFTGGSLIMATKQISDYDKTAGAFREKLKAAHGKQEGHPQKAANIIYDHINNDSSTLRLALGTIPLKTIGMKIQQLQSDLDANKTKAERAVYASS